MHSITSEENATRCQVFTQVGYQGASVTLKPGRRYLTLDAMGLGNPVMSLRKFYKVISDRFIKLPVIKWLSIFFFSKQSAPLALYQDEEYAGKALVRLRNFPLLMWNVFAKKTFHFGKLYTRFFKIRFVLTQVLEVNLGFLTARLRNPSFLQWTAYNYSLTSQLLI